MRLLPKFITENIKITKAFDKTQQPEEKVDDIEKMGCSEYEMFLGQEYYFNTIYGTTLNKQKHINEYREMAMFPEVAEALDQICDEAIVHNDQGDIVSLQFDDEKLSKNNNKVKNIQKEFDYVMTNVLDFNDNAFNLFRKFYVEAELYGEMVINPKSPKQGIKRVVLLPPETVFPQYDEYHNIEKYVQKIDGTTNKQTGQAKLIEFSPNQIAYINSGIYGCNKMMPLSFIERAKVAYRQLKWMEDALVIYRIVRAPERRVFTIDVGNLPKKKAEQYMKDIVRRYKQKKIYNPTTGEIDVGKQVLCLDLKTNISLLDGRELPLTKIIEEYENGKQLETYSINEKSGEIVPGKIKWAGITRKNAKVLEVTLDNGKKEIVTPDHKFIMHDLSTKRADEMIEGDSIRALYRKESSKDEKELNGYDMYFDEISNEWKYTHRLISNYYGLLSEDKRTTHHIDFDKKNNNSDNLIGMNSKQHWIYHSSIMEERWETLSEENRKKWCKNIGIGSAISWKTEEHRKNNKIGHNIFWNSKQGKVAKEILSKNATKYNIEQKKAQHMCLIYNGSELHKEHNKNRRIGQNKRWNKPGYRKEFSKLKTIEYPENLHDFLKKAILNIIQEKDLKKIKYNDIHDAMNSDKEFMNIMNNINENKCITGRKNKVGTHFNKLIGKSALSILRICGYDGLRGLKREFVANHKVKQIKYLEERMDTGCINVETQRDSDQCHNFRLSSGIYVKNSMIEDYFLPRRTDGSGPSVETLPGGTSLGEIDDILYFVKKLYKALKVPTKRLEEGENMFQPSGKEGEITREEIKFAKYVFRVRNRFVDYLKQIFFTHLKLTGLWKQYKLDENSLKIIFNEDNEWKESKKLANWRERLDIFREMKEYAPEDTNEIFSNEFLLKEILKLSDEDISDMEKQRKREKEKAERDAEEFDSPDDNDDDTTVDNDPDDEKPDKETEPPEDEEEPEEEAVLKT